MKHLFTATAVIELGTGFALLIAPVVTAQLLLGAEISGAAVPIARVTAAALLGLGFACWFARVDVQSRAARGLLAAVLVYDLGAVLVLGAAGIQLPTAGINLWLAVALHTAMAIWCVALLRQKAALQS
ncbi:MAG: hypothetical protein ACLPWG_03515 [Steroidobacteraceae bacterium]